MVKFYVHYFLIPGHILAIVALFVSSAYVCGARPNYYYHVYGIGPQRIVQKQRPVLTYSPWRSSEHATNRTNYI